MQSPGSPGLSSARSRLRWRDPTLSGRSNLGAGANRGGDAHTKERGPRSTAIRSPLAPGEGVGTARGHCASPDPRPREKGGPTRGRRIPAGLGPHPWPPTWAPRSVPIGFTARRPRAAQRKGRVGDSFPSGVSYTERRPESGLRGSTQSGQVEPPCSRQPPRTPLLTRRDIPSAPVRGITQKVSGREVPQSSAPVVSTSTIPHLVAPCSPWAPSLTL